MNDRVKQGLATAVLAAAAATAGAQTPKPQAEDYSKMDKSALLEKSYARYEEVCKPTTGGGVSLKQNFFNVAGKIHEPDLRQLLQKGVTICLDTRQTPPGSLDFTSKSIWGAFYNTKELAQVGKILALRDDGQGNDSFSPLNRIAEAVSRFNSRNVADSPVGTVLYGTAQQVLGSITGGSRDNRQYVQWEPAAAVADQVSSKGLAAPPLKLNPPAPGS